MFEMMSDFVGEFIVAACCLCNILRQRATVQDHDKGLRIRIEKTKHYDSQKLKHARIRALRFVALPLLHTIQHAKVAASKFC